MEHKCHYINNNAVLFDMYFDDFNNTFDFINKDIQYLQKKDIYRSNIIPEKYNLFLTEPMLKEQYIEILKEETIKEIEKYKNNKDLYLEEFYKNINNDVLSDSLSFPKYNDISSKIIEEELKDIFVDDIKNYIKVGLNEMIEKKEEIIALFKIKNINKWFISLDKKYKKIEYLKDYQDKYHKKIILKNFFRYYPLFIELLVIVNTFYEYKQKEVKYDFIKNIERMKHYVFMTRESNYYMNMR
jgi:translation elongation factor EF-G